MRLGAKAVFAICVLMRNPEWFCDAFWRKTFVWDSNSVLRPLQFPLGWFCETQVLFPLPVASARNLPFGSHEHAERTRRRPEHRTARLAGWLVVRPDPGFQLSFLTFHSPCSLLGVRVVTKCGAAWNDSSSHQNESNFVL